MKKYIYLTAISALALIGFQGCDKEDEEKEKIITKVIDVTLNMNETYNLTMGEALYGDELKITKQAGHFSLSKVEELPKANPKDKEALESSKYTYTPSLNYVGNDEVTITGETDEMDGDKCNNEEHQDGEEKEGRNNQKEGDDDDDEATVNTTIRFHIINNPIKN